MQFKVVHPVNGKTSKQHSDIGYAFFPPFPRASWTWPFILVIYRR